MTLLAVRSLRKSLAVSRAELARYLGVSEVTVARWESGEKTTEPKGLQAVLLRALADAAARNPPESIARIVRSCGVDHRAALKALLDAASADRPTDTAG